MYDNNVWRAATRQTMIIISWYSSSVPIPGVQSGLSGCILPRISPVRGAQPHTDITRGIPHRELWSCQGSVFRKGFGPKVSLLSSKRETPEQKAFRQRFPFRRLQKYISCVNIRNMSARLIPCLALERRVPLPLTYQVLQHLIRVKWGFFYFLTVLLLYTYTVAYASPFSAPLVSAVLFSFRQYMQ